jgi:hypothetical protein
VRRRRITSRKPAKARQATKAKRGAASKPARNRRVSALNRDTEGARLARELAEAREQQTATSEVLRVIGTSPSDEQPVYQTIVRSAVSLCGSLFALVFRFDGELLHFAAGHSAGPGYVELLKTKYPMRPDNSQVAGRVVLTKSVVRLKDALADLPKQEQITTHFCIQGWSGVAKWGGVPMRHILELVRPTPDARYAVFYSFADGGEVGRYYDVHKISNMRHELTILAYEMNGAPVSVLHGAPLRLRCENELGFKMVKWIAAIEFVHDFADLGAGQGGYNEDHEFYGYRMPI